MDSKDVFIGFHKTSRTDANTMLKLVKDSLLTFGLPFSGIRGQGYDGASNMSGRENGLQAKVLTENPKALYLYCFGHQLNLVVQDSLKAIPEVAIALERMHSVVQFIKNSPKNWDRFKSIVNFASDDALSFPKDNRMLRPLCTTGWVMRLPAGDTFLVHYHEILEFLQSIKEDYTEPANNREKTDSFLRNLETFKNYFCLRVIQKVLQATSPIYVQCQEKGATVGQVKTWVNTLILTLTAEWQGNLIQMICMRV